MKAAVTTEVDRRVLLAERDAARRERTLRELRANVAALELKLQYAGLENDEYVRQIGRLEAEIRRLYDTPSWRWSAPVRRVTHLWQRFRASMGGPPPDPPAAPPDVKVAEATPEIPLTVREQAILRRLQQRG